LIDFILYSSVNELPEFWDDLPNKDLFLKTPFLKALERSCPHNIHPQYVGIFKSNQLVGIAIIQRVEMYLDDIFRNANDRYLTQQAKQIISNIVRGNALIIGNIMHTGQHGLYFNNHAISYQEYLQQLSLAVDKVKAKIKRNHNKKIRLIAFKDYFEDDTIHSNAAFFKSEKVYNVQVQPNMVFSILPSWNTIGEYSAALTKKYRDRYKSARKKGTDIVKRELDMNMLRVLQKDMFQLYKNVSDNARVNTFILNQNHFVALKEELNDNFKVFGYFITDELVGFYTIILNNKSLETYFLGYNQKYQHKHQMYLNMLFDMVQFGIENKYEQIVFARTAMEIKSSVGAEPKAMHIYMKHTNFVANTMLQFIVKYLSPVKVWTERHPFK